MTSLFRAAADKPSLRGRRTKQAFAHQLAATRRLVNFTDEDERLVRETADVVRAASDAIAHAMASQLLSQPETAAYFARADGRVDHGELELRAETLRGWLRTVIEAPLDDELAAYLAHVGRAHSGRGGGAATQVKARYMVALMGFLQAAVLGALDGSVPDRRTLLGAVAAWNKCLMIYLDVFLAVYGGGGGTPHWY